MSSHTCNWQWTRIFHENNMAQNWFWCCAAQFLRKLHKVKVGVTFLVTWGWSQFLDELSASNFNSIKCILAWLNIPRFALLDCQLLVCTHACISGHQHSIVMFSKKQSVSWGMANASAFSHDNQQCVIMQKHSCFPTCGNVNVVNTRKLNVHCLHWKSSLLACSCLFVGCFVGVWQRAIDGVLVELICQERHHRGCWTKLVDWIKLGTSHVCQWKLFIDKINNVFQKEWLMSGRERKDMAKANPIETCMYQVFNDEEKCPAFSHAQSHVVGNAGHSWVTAAWHNRNCQCMGY